MPARRLVALSTAVACLVFAPPALAQHHAPASPTEVEAPPPLPAGMTLDDALERAAQPPPKGWPDVVADHQLYVFTLCEQLELRSAATAADQVVWDAQGWLGGALDKLWWKSEGQVTFAGRDRGESETDLLYSRLVSPFWSLQAGLQYANQWGGSDYGDRVSGVIALLGLAPYKLEVDSSLYVSEHGDVTVAIEVEYDLRVTQRLVAQPRLEAGIAFDDVPMRALASGFTDAACELRLRYEIRRELAPYLGVRYETLLGATEDLAEQAGEDTDHFRYLAGLRFAF